jgi:hypothetical protein
MLQSQVKATLNINDAWLDIRDGFEHVAKTDRRPTVTTFPLVISPSSKAGILFTVRLSSNEGGSFFLLKVKSDLWIVLLAGSLMVFNCVCI